MPEFPDLNSQTPTDAAIGRILQSCGREFDEQLVAFMESSDPDATRKARVALRRLTTTLDAFPNLLRKGRRRRLRRRVKVLFRSLGRVRDADLMSSSASPAAVAALREATRSALRKSGAVTLGARLQAPRTLDRLIRSGKSAKRARRQPLGATAAEAMTRVRKQCLSFGLDLARLSDHKIHGLRKSIKAWRYLAEFFADCWPQDSVASDRRQRFQALQDALGVLTDRMIVGPAAGPTPDAGSDAAMMQAQELWLELAGEPPWWHNGDKT